MDGVVVDPDHAASCWVGRAVVCECAGGLSFAGGGSGGENAKSFWDVVSTHGIEYFQGEEGQLREGRCVPLMTAVV